jgi:hypothetical protein
MIIGKSISDSATLSVSSQIGTLPGVAVQRVQPRDIWRSYDNADQNIVFDLSTITNFNCVAVLYHNGDTTAMWRIRTADTEPNLTASPTYDSATSSPLAADIPMRQTGEDDRYARFHSVKNIGSQSNRWVRIDFQSLSGMLRLDVGRVMICDALVLAPSFNWQLLPTEDAIVIPTVSGMWTSKGRRRREISWTYPGMTDAQGYADSGEIDQIAHSEPVVASVIETDANRQTDFTFYGVISGVSAIYQIGDAIRKQYQLSELERP